MRHVDRFFIIMLFILIPYYTPCHASWSSRDLAKFEDLQIKVASSGTIRVIVKLDVPRIDELQSQSHAFRTVEPRREKEWGGTNADRNLADAISTSAEFVKFALGKASFRVHHIYKSIPCMALEVSPEALTTLELMPEVLAIEEDVPTPLPQPVQPSTPAGLSAPMLNNTVNITGASNAWSMGYTGAGRYVAIVDTGIRKTHEMFTGKTIVEACYALGQDGVGPGGDCPNGQISMNGTGAAVHYASSYSGYDHGTHVSGIAAGYSATLSGMAKDANIIAVKVFSKFAATYSACGGVACILSWTSDQVAGLDYVYSIRGNYSIAAVNMSLGGGKYRSPCDNKEAASKASIDNLRAVGIATAIATGNNGYCGYISAPACISSSVAVGASDDSDVEAYFNNWDPTMQKLFAPGVQILSSTGGSDTEYQEWSGTSMATPHVTGAWALIKQAVPSGSVTDILSALQSTGVNITTTCPSPSGSVPRIKVDAAINVLIPTSTSSTTTTIGASSTTTIGSSSTTSIGVSSTTTVDASSTTTAGVSSSTTTIGLSTTTTVQPTTSVNQTTTSSTVSTTTTTAEPTSTTTTATIDSDNDGVSDTQDNCPNTPNGPNLGTCMPGSDKTGATCTSDADCVIGCSTNGTCSMNQEDTNQNGVGDVCEPFSTTTTVPLVTTTTTILTTTTTAPPVTTTTIVPDADHDGIPDAQDNCPNTPNGPNLGTCMPGSDKTGATCTSDADCVIGCSTNGTCSMNQEDTNGDGIGDVCPSS